jgi:hypothetical protein
MSGQKDVRPREASKSSIPDTAVLPEYFLSEEIINTFNI